MRVVFGIWDLILGNWESNLNPQKSLFDLWKSFLGVQESILRSKGVVFAPMSKLSILLKVYLGSLEVNLWSLECEFGLWHSKLRPLGVDFRLPKGRVLLQRRGFLEHSPRVPFGLRALFYLMLLRIFLNFPYLGTPRTYWEGGGWVGGHILNLRIFAAEIFVSKWLIFADGTKIWFISNFYLCESILASGNRFCHWELILTVRVIFLPRRVIFEQVAVDFDPVSQLWASGIDFWLWELILSL